MVNYVDVNWLRRGNKDFQAYLYNVAGDEEDSVSFERPKISTNELAQIDWEIAIDDSKSNTTIIHPAISIIQQSVISSIAFFNQASKNCR